MKYARQAVVGFAFLLSAISLGFQTYTLRDSYEAAKLFAAAHIWLSTDYQLAFAAMQQAGDRFPYAAEYREDALVPLARMAEHGAFVDMRLATLAYDRAHSALGYDQNVLTAWLDYLGHAGLTQTPGYQSALERLYQTNPYLPEGFQFQAWSDAAQGNKPAVAYGAELMLHYATTPDQVAAAGILSHYAR